MTRLATGSDQLMSKKWHHCVLHRPRAKPFTNTNPWKKAGFASNAKVHVGRFGDPTGSRLPSIRRHPAYALYVVWFPPIVSFSLSCIVVILNFPSVGLIFFWWAATLNHPACNIMCAGRKCLRSKKWDAPAHRPKCAITLLRTRCERKEERVCLGLSVVYYLESN
jgi:hypothetical protein